MQTETFTLNPLDDASDAAQAFERYDLVMRQSLMRLVD